MTEANPPDAEEAPAYPMEQQRALHESLSAAIDDEAEELELRRVLNATRDDPELRAKWQRAHLIGGAIRGEAARIGNGGNSETLPWHDEPALADGAAATAGGSPSRTAWWLRATVAGGGLAAAVALGVVTLFGDGDFNIGASDKAPPVVAERAAPPPTLARLPSELDLRRADAYLLRHAQHTAVSSPPAAMPFAKVLAGDDGRRIVVTNRFEREPSRR